MRTREPNAPVPRKYASARRAERLVPKVLLPFGAQFRFLLVGVWNTLFGYGVFVVLYFLAGGRGRDSLVIVISYAFAITHAYLGYRYIVFRSRGRVFREFPRFSLVYLLTMVVNLTVFPLALRLLPLGPYMVQALFAVGVVVASYLGHRNFSFKDPAARPPAKIARSALADGRQGEPASPARARGE